MAKINVKNTSVKVGTINNSDYISLTDIAMYKTDDKIAGIANWIQKRNKIEFLSILQTLYNPNFKPLEFEGFKKEAGLNAYNMSALKWISATNAIGITYKENMFDFQFINILKLKLKLICLFIIHQIVYICINMSTPLPIRTARSEWTFYFYTYE
jgi:hypothetical protein